MSIAIAAIMMFVGNMKVLVSRIKLCIVQIFVESLVFNKKKMRRILNYLLLASVSLSISCNHLSNSAMSDYSNVTQIQYDDTAEEVIEIDQVVDSCDFVRLETLKANLIGRIDQLLLNDKYIVVVDKHVAQSIFVFDNNGLYLNRISRLGNGHAEYLMINHVAINERNEICILDNAKEQMMFFDIKGKLLSSKHFPFRAKSVEFLGNDNLLFRVENCYAERGYKEIEKSCYVLTDTKGEIVYTFGEDHSYKNPTFQSYSDEVLKFDGRVFGRLDHGNTIYEFEKDSVRARCELSLKEKELYAPTVEDMSTPGVYKEKRLKDPSFSGFFFFCKDYSCYKLMFPERMKLYTWFFRTNGTERILTLSTESDDPILSSFYNPIARFNDNTLVQDISPLSLLSKKDVIMEKSIIENLDKLFEDLTLEDNPVLFFYTFDFNK